MRKIFRIAGLVAFVVLFALGPAGVNGLKAYADDNPNHFMTITLHAGEMGYFDGDPEIKEKASVQRRGDIFKEDTVPETVDSSYIFVGWATTPDAEYSDISNGISNTSWLGTDIYALYSNKAVVNYNVTDGYLEVDGQQLQHYRKEYTPGTKFVNYIPMNTISDSYVFDGWYASYYEGDVYYTEDTDVTEEEVDLHVDWRMSAEVTEAVLLDEEKPVNLSEYSVKVFKFTPAESGVYEVRTTGRTSEDGRIVMLSVLDEEANTLKTGTPVDPFDVRGDYRLAVELEAGQTYFINGHEVDGEEIAFSVLVSRAEMVDLTLHISEQYRGQIWFDEDEGALTKVVQVARGENLANYDNVQFGLSYENKDKVIFNGWRTTPEPDDSIPHHVVINESMDVYGDFQLYDLLVLDANGGYFMDGNFSLTYNYKYDENTVFAPVSNPVVNDDGKMFGGWSRNADAEVPDEDIVEGEVMASELGDRLYAVYVDKVLETFVVPDERMIYGNVEHNTYEKVVGQGVEFCTIWVSPTNPAERRLGWMDQNGVFIASDDDHACVSDYRVNEDSVFTLVVGREMAIDANGGFFPNMGWAEYGWMLMSDDLVFSAEAITEQFGPVFPYDTAKYFAGWATTPDAEEPDLIDGVSSIEGVDTIYAVYLDDTYYIHEGGDATWERGSEDGLRVVVKRENDDEETFYAFTGAKVDGEVLEDFSREEGSLILMVDTEYLESLEGGGHELLIEFGRLSVMTSFTIVEPGEDGDDEVPETGAPETGANSASDGMGYVNVVGGVGVVVLVGAVWMAMKMSRERVGN